MYSPWPPFCFYHCPTQEFPDRVRHEGRTEEEAPPPPLGFQVPWWSGQHQAGILVHFLPRHLHTTGFHSQSSSWESGGTIFSSPLHSSSHSTEALSSLSFSLLLAFKFLVSQPWLPVCPWYCHCVLWVQDPTFSLFPLSSMPLSHHMLCQDPDSVCLRLCSGTCDVAIAGHLVLCSWVP